MRDSRRQHHSHHTDCCSICPSYWCGGESGEFH
ncbi:hypothetical protein GBAR_LOCUS27751 [Geodia barretti]|uniref:Uncharacterized protein n=1 Tax=Geodia barretti TaxID=519541 RepID=A0AA35TM63_GEOBA|nr:hypothetical protein GBAR_LOCUS27751 [Geodia barretti]